MAHTGRMVVNLSLNIPKSNINKGLDISTNAMINYCMEHGITFENTFSFKHSLRNVMIREFADNVHIA